MEDDAKVTEYGLRVMEDDAKVTEYGLPFMLPPPYRGMYIYGEPESYKWTDVQLLHPNEPEFRQILEEHEQFHTKTLAAIFTEHDNNPGPFRYGADTCSAELYLEQKRLKFRMISLERQWDKWLTRYMDKLDTILGTKRKRDEPMATSGRQVAQKKDGGDYPTSGGCSH